MRRLYDGFIAALQVFSAALCLGMLGVVLVGVFYRYVVDESLSWYDEFAGYLLVWLTMYGSVVALARRKHISFDTLVLKLPPGWQRAAEVFGILCVAGFSLVLLAAGWQLVREMSDETAVSLPALRMSWIYGVMPISGALLLLIGLVQLAGAVTGRSPGAGSAKPMEEGQ